MKSTARTDSLEEDDVPEEELQRFDDFTLASSWERFISDIEATCRQWMADGPRNLLEKGAIRLEESDNLYKVKSDLKSVTKSYCFEFYFRADKSGSLEVGTDDWNSNSHDLQICFGVKDFLLIAPQSASGVVLDAPESSKLLSAVAIALSNCASLWPAFVPVHDPSRKAYIGIQNMGTVFTRRFEADRVGSQVPVKLMHLEGLYELFVSKFVYSAVDFSMHIFRVHFMMRLTYQYFPYDEEDEEDYMYEGMDEAAETEENHGVETRSKVHWDDDCPWSEWYSAEDPLKGYELVITWSGRSVESTMEMAELENASPHEAGTWALRPILSPSLEGTRIDFASQLLCLVEALDMSFEAQFMEDFVSVENSSSENMKTSMIVPPPTVLDRVIKDLFHEGSKRVDYRKGEHRLSRGLKGAPLESLFAQFCLHSMWFGNCNIRAISILWIEFVREVRWCWEESQQLPKMPVDGSIDLSTCLIYQKLHLLAICIEKKREMNEEFEDCIGSEDGLQAASVEAAKTVTAPPDPDAVKKHDSSGAEERVRRRRRGSAGAVGDMMLLKSHQSLHAPFTQDPPLMTEDMHEERLQAVEAFGDSLNFSGQLEKDVLLSDMSAFKAANPEAVFEDFIRWHSPGDWESHEPQAAEEDDSKQRWPPHGRLSQRMAEHGNLWRRIWNDAPPLPAYDQKPLLDPTREGEKIVHYLETVRPCQLLEQMVCTAMRASADTLNQTNHGDMAEMSTELAQLYLTLKSTLSTLPRLNHLSDKTETMAQLRSVCGVFGHVEKLVTLAASLHRKLLEAPRLARVLFSHLYTSSFGRTMEEKTKKTTKTATLSPKEKEGREEVRFHERRVVSELFTPPSANQSWRKVLSMGNLLNGHEPIQREMVLSKRERVDSGEQYSAGERERGVQGVSEEEIETHRMYVSGTSNDLRVALSLTSSD